MMLMMVMLIDNNAVGVSDGVGVGHHRCLALS